MLWSLPSSCRIQLSGSQKGTSAWATQGQSLLNGKMCVPKYYGKWISVAVQAVSHLSPKQLWPPYYSPTFPLAQFFELRQGEIPFKNVLYFQSWAFTSIYYLDFRVPVTHGADFDEVLHWVNKNHYFGEGIFPKPWVRISNGLSSLMF